jgi:hypothetical protein
MRGFASAGLLALGAVGLLACKTISDEAKQEIAKPVDCATAQEDMALLEGEKVSVAEQAAAGVRTVFPIALIGGIAQGDLGNRARVAIGDYNRQLDEKMFQIRQQCGITEGASLTADGLMELERARVGFAAVKPGADFGRYDKLMVLPVAFAFKERSRKLRDSQLDDLRRYFREDFTRELQQKGNYTIVTTPGPDVLLVRAALVNIDVTAPVERGRDDVYIRDAGEVTMVAELRDSQSGELLARAADRRRIEMPGGSAYESNPVTNVANTRRLFRQWASLLRERLDQAHELHRARELQEAGE